MTYDVEILLRQNERVFTERQSHDGDPVDWTDKDLRAVLTQVLQAVDRVLNPGETADRPISFRGLNWIVHPGPQGVVLAFEIHSASAVAGPFPIAQDRLEQLVNDAVRAVDPPVTVH